MERLVFYLLEYFHGDINDNFEYGQTSIFPSSHSWGEHFKGASDGVPGNVVSKMVHSEAIVTNPMVLGLVPVGMDFPDKIKGTSNKKSARKINQLLQEICTREQNSILYDPKICFEQMKVTISPDGLPYFAENMHTTNMGKKILC